MENVILADNQEITICGMKYLLEQINICKSVSTASTKSQLIQILSDHPQSLVVLDYTLFDFTSINDLAIVYERFPEASWLLFSEELSDSFLRHIIVCGLTMSIVYKNAQLSELEEALWEALNGQTYLMETLKSHLQLLGKSLSTQTDIHLTNAEIEILKEIAQGKTTKEIAANRNLSFHTINTHRKNIFRKLDVNNAHEAIKYAIRAGIVDVSDYYI